MRHAVVPHRQRSPVHRPGRRISLLRSTKRTVTDVSTARTPPRVPFRRRLFDVFPVSHVETIAAIHAAHHATPSARRAQTFRLLSTLVTTLTVDRIVDSSTFLVVSVDEQRPFPLARAQSLDVRVVVQLLGVRGFEQVSRRRQVRGIELLGRFALLSTTRATRLRRRRRCARRRRHHHHSALSLPRRIFPRPARDGVPRVDQA